MLSMDAHEWDQKNKMSAQRCIVIGGKGFVGAGVVAAARERGYEVIALGREDYAAAKGMPCEWLINANGNSRKFLARENPRLDFQLSVDSVYASLVDFNPRHYVFLSSIDVYANFSDPAHNHESTPLQPAALSPYGLHKSIAEDLVRYHRPDALILRMAGFVGPGLWKNPIFDLLTGQPLRVHPLSAYQYLHTHVLGETVFALLAAGVRGETFNVAGRGVISLQEIAALIPECQVPEQTDLSRERYEVSTEKVSGYVNLPASEDTVWRFIRDVLQGRVPLGQGARAP